MPTPPAGVGSLQSAGGPGRKEARGPAHTSVLGAPKPVSNVASHGGVGWGPEKWFQDPKALYVGDPGSVLDTWTPEHS